MPASKAKSGAGKTELTAALTVEKPVAAHETVVVLDGAPPDTDVTVAVVPASSGAFERVVHTDDDGHAEAVVVFPTSGPAQMVATVVTVEPVAVAEVDVSGSPYPESEPREE